MCCVSASSSEAPTAGQAGRDKKDFNKELKSGDGRWTEKTNVEHPTVTGEGDISVHQSAEGKVPGSISVNPV